MLSLAERIDMELHNFNDPDFYSEYVVYGCDLGH